MPDGSLGQEPVKKQCDQSTHRSEGCENAEDQQRNATPKASIGRASNSAGLLKHAQLVEILVLRHE